MTTTCFCLDIVEDVGACFGRNEYREMARKTAAGNKSKYRKIDARCIALAILSLPTSAMIAKVTG